MDKYNLSDDDTYEIGRLIFWNGTIALWDSKNKKIFIYDNGKIVFCCEQMLTLQEMKKLLIE